MHDAEAQADRLAMDLLASVHLEKCAGAPIGELSYGQRKLVALLRVFASRPKLLLLDEPLAGLSPSMKQLAIQRIEALASSGVAVIVVEHDIVGLRDRGWNGAFLEQGRLRLTGQLPALLASRDVAAAYLGDRSSTAIANDNGRNATVLALSGNDRPAGEFALSSFSAGYGNQVVVHPLSLDVPRGEILGIVGLNASGKSTLLNGIFGFADRLSGCLTLDGTDITRLMPHRAAREGILYLPQGGGLVESLTLRENLSLITSTLNRGTSMNGMNAVEQSPAVVRYGNRLVGALSAGERQMAFLARLDIGRPRLVLLDEPSIGLSPGKLHEVARTIRDRWESWGRPPMLVAEQNLPFLQDLATRLLVLRAGCVAALLPSSASVELVEGHLGFGKEPRFE